MATRKKTFDCVEMKRRGAERVRRATQGMTRDEELAYWSHGTKELLRLQRRKRRVSGPASAPSSMPSSPTSKA